MKRTVVFASAALLLVSAVSHSHGNTAAQRAFDETAWTRASWQEFKLDFPVRPTQPSDDGRLSVVR